MNDSQIIWKCCSIAKTKYTQNFGSGNLKRNHLEGVGVDEKTMPEWTLEK
jgi:hypothetical protein